MKNETQSDFFTSIAKTVIEKLDDEAPVRKSVQKILLNSVGQRDMSVNECMLITHNKLYVEFSKSSRVVDLRGSNVIRTNMSINDEGITTKDNWQEAYWQRESCPHYQQLCKDYPNIEYPKNPKDISLREFAENFTKKWKYSKRNVFLNFIPSYKYVVHKGKTNYEDWCRYILLMDKPGCTLENVGKSFSSCEEELRDFVENHEFCPEVVKNDFRKSQKVVDEAKETSAAGDAFDELYLEEDKAAENAPKEDWMECFSLGFTDNKNNENEDHIASDDDASNYDIDLGEIPKKYDWQADCKELNLTSSEIKEAGGWIEQKKKSTSTLTREQDSVNPINLNTKQKKAYKFITSWIDSMNNDPDNTKPIYLNISGRAGCGKTYFLNCVSQYAQRVGGLNFLLKAAPTGTAAFLIGGDTLHSMFRLPLQASTKKDIPDLNVDSLDELQTRFKDCKMLVIDEKSMVGLYMMYQIDKRLKEIKSMDSDIPFGGLSVVLMGDFAQLPPVGDKPMFTSEGKLLLCQSRGKMLFHLFNRTIIFDEIMRQQGDDQKEFRNVLDRLADGNFNKEDFYFLAQRNLSGDQISDIERTDFLKNATKLCARNKDLISHNITRIKDLGTPIAVIKSENSDKAVANILAAKAHGLPSQVMLAKGCKVILTSNLWKQAGLTNGAKGVVKYIVYEKGLKPKALPNMVIVQFDQYIGPSYLEDFSKCVPIVPIRRDWYSGKKACWRYMLPLKPAYGTTIHTSQGQSLDKVIINLGKKEFCNGLTYTAISRCKKIEFLSFDPPILNGDRFREIYRAKVFKDRRVQDLKEKEEEKKIHK